MIHATNKDSICLENDPQIDIHQIKKTLDEMGWSGWLVIERSRDAKNHQIQSTITKRILLI